jgi:hypothetical protein
MAGYVLAGLLALIPVLRMTGVVLDGSGLQHNDYWLMLPRFINPDGGLDIVGLFHFQNEHPIAVPQAIYWLNFRLFSGSNITLGLVDVGLVVGQLVVVVLLVRRSAFRPVERMAVVVVASALLFDLTGTWNFSKAMSGTAWFSANLFALIAVYLRSRDRRGAAFGLAVVAAVSYGTGIAAWPAVIATGVSHRPIRQWWREWPYAVGFVATFAWYQMSGPGNDHGPFDPLEIVRAAASMLGFVLGAHGALGELVGCIALIGVPVLVVGLGLFSRAAGVAGWIGVATFGWLATVELAYGRLALFGDQNRYSSLAALTWVGFAALSLYALREIADRLAARNENAAARATPWLSFAVLVPILLGAITAGRGHADTMLEANTTQELREIALRVGLTDDTRYLVRPFGSERPIRDLLIETGHYPFVDDWDLDCGLLGEDLDVPQGTPEPPTTGEVLSGGPAPALPGAIEITGRVFDDRPIRCIVITNDQDLVVGAAAVGADPSRIVGQARRQPSGTGFRALAPSGEDKYFAYVILDRSVTPRLLGEFDAS